ncbi:fimbrillin family protein [Parabacteroides sp.]
MKYTKRLLISMSFFAFLLTVSGCTSEEVIDGGSSKEHPVIQTICATKSDFTTTQEVDVPLTRTTIDGYKTTFNDGDKIGLFAIKGGAIVDGINNMLLTCAVTTDAATTTTNWTLPADTKIYYYEGVTYIAYYPYNSGVSIEGVSELTKDNIVSSLVGNANLQPKDDQSTADNYAASDLMIATANANASDILKVTLSLEFKHQFSLLVMTPQVLCTNITEPASAGFTYRGNKSYIVDPNTNNVTLSDITPLKMSDGSYRAIMKPDVLKNLSVKYQTENSKSISYSCAENAISITSGQYYTLTVNSPVEYTESVVRPLRPGDFVFQNTTTPGIEIYPGDGELASGKIPDYQNAVGIVVTCDPSRMTDTQCNEKGWNHAYVIGFVTDPAAHSWGAYEDVAGLENYTTETCSTNMNGYSETKCLDTNYSKYVIIDYTMGVIRSNKIPDNLATIRSDWFIPSVGQYYDLLENLCEISPANFSGTKTASSWTETTNAGTMYSKLQSHYTKLGKSLLLNGSFWSSSEYDTNNVWYLSISNSQIGLKTRDKGAYLNPNMFLYAFFAF